MAAMVEKTAHERVKIALALHKSSFSEIARELDVAPATVAMVSQGYRRSRRIENAIADAIGTSPEMIWPTRYLDEASRLGKEAHERVKSALALYKSSFSVIARELDVAPATVAMVSQGYRRSRRIEKAIADVIGTSPEMIWPARYPDEAS
jgi:lambda repressor-like predicted transcriptional regulator